VNQARRSKTALAPAVAETATTAGHEAFVLAASFLLGGITLVVEILGTRILCPYYGASIYVWSSLIGVTLGSLTIGYLVGGSAADRWPPLRAFAYEIIGGALALLLVPWIRKLVLSATTPLGLRAGSLVSAMILFAPPLILLSMTGPSAIRLVTTSFAVLGRGVGKVYGVSTLGSTLGAILTGFVLIPSFAVPTLLVGAAAILLCLGAWGLVLARQSAAAAAAVIAAVLAVATGVRSVELTPEVIQLTNSFHGELKVIEVEDVRVLMIDGITNGFVDRNTFESHAPYLESFAYLPLARPEAKRALCIGLGAGSLPRTLQLQHHIATDTVEIDPEIVTIARKYFGFPREMSVSVEDGRTFVERATGPYDLVVLDAFHSESHPAHLFTREFFARVGAIMTPDGVLGINMAGLPQGTASAAWRSVRKTLRERFTHVRVFAGVQVEGSTITNIFIVASQAELPDPEAVGKEPAMVALSRNELPVDREDDAAIVVTDDYNPLDDLQRAALVNWREELIRQMEPVLLFDGTS
jgi:spermidine synthase